MNVAAALMDWRPPGLFRTPRARVVAAAREGASFLEGYAAIFGVDSLPSHRAGRDCRVRFLRGAFARSLASGVRVDLLRNHDWDLAIGNTEGGALTLWEDARGLAFRFQLPSGDEGRRIAVDVRCDELRCSLGYQALASYWIEGRPGELPIRVVSQAALAEVSLLERPNFPQTSVRVVTK